MLNVVIGFYDNGMMWMDQGVDLCFMDVFVVKGVDGWGFCFVLLGLLLLLMVEESEVCFLVMNVSWEMIIDGGGVG